MLFVITGLSTFCSLLLIKFVDSGHAIIIGVLLGLLGLTTVGINVVSYDLGAE